MTSTFARRWLRTGSIIAVIDFLFSSVLVMFFYQSTFARLWQGVASTLIGPSAFDRGASTIALGLIMHIGVAFAWSLLFLLAFDRVAAIRRAARSVPGALALAVVYGPLIWLTMSFLVIPSMTHRPPTIAFRWWVQFFGHIPFVAMPIVWSVRARASSSTAH